MVLWETNYYLHLELEQSSSIEPQFCERVPSLKFHSLCVLLTKAAKPNSPRAVPIYLYPYLTSAGSPCHKSSMRASPSQSAVPHMPTFKQDETKNTPKGEAIVHVVQTLVSGSAEKTKKWYQVNNEFKSAEDPELP